MKIIYKNKKIEVICTDLKEAKKSFNIEVVKKLSILMFDLINSNSLYEISQIKTHNLHSLIGDKTGLYALDLGRRLGYRLIIEPKTDYKDKSNLLKYYSEIKIIEIIEVTNHYD